LAAALRPELFFESRPLAGGFFFMIF
jgi:hypothetical protein